jgi:N-carbamoylputrescine amidase
MRDLRVAAVCMHSETGEVRENLDRTASYVARASEAGANVVCFPELSLTGYSLKNPSLLYKELGQEAVIERVLHMARDKNLIIIAGLVERSLREKPYISQIVAGPRGLMGVYRKTHLSPPEAEKYEAGQEISVFSDHEVTFGVQLCYESHFPEISTVMALKGIEVLFLPHASPRGEPAEKMDSWLRHVPSRAFDNGVYVVACNQVGKNREGLDFPGVAVAIGPDGRIMESCKGKEERLLFADLNARFLDEVRKHRMRYFLPNRRPELYKELCSPAFHGSRFGNSE